MSDNFIQTLRRHGYNKYDLVWEDVARWQYCTLGPHISDVSLRGVHAELYPVVRVNNFDDSTFDIEMGKIKLLHNGVITTLHDLLKKMDLLRPQEVFAQAQVQSCLLPENKCGGPTQFCPGLYNYQAQDYKPTVMVFTITSMGVTIHVPGGMEHKLLMNHNGTLHWYSAQALGDIRGTGPVAADEMTDAEHRENFLLIVQVPLFVEEQPRNRMMGLSSNTDMARVTMGASTGERYVEPTRKWVRDDRLSVRVTFCSYRIVKGILTAQDAEEIVKQLKEMRNLGVNYGSLVTGTQDRPTRPDLSRPLPQDDPFQKAAALWGGTRFFG